MTQEEIDKEQRIKNIEKRLEALEKAQAAKAEPAAETSASELPNSGEAKSEEPA